MNEQTDATGAAGVTSDESIPGTVSAAPTVHHGDEAGPDEFQLTVRKLEMPVRPRGVLAE